MRTKVLVTGSKGQLAQTILDEFYNNNDNILFDFVSKEELDITSKKQLKSFFTHTNYHYCLNCAAYTNVDQSEITPEVAFLINAEAVKNLAEICKKEKVVLIHISTDYVFDGNSLKPYKETDATNPINQYGASKLLGEKYLEQTHKNYFIIRTSWLYSSFGKNFLNTIIDKINKDNEIKVITSQKGTPTSCVELSNFIYFLIKNNESAYGTYHFSSKGEATWYDFALHIAKHYINYDLTNVNPVENFQSKAERPKYSVLDNSKAQLLYNQSSNWQVEVTNIVNKRKNSYN